MSIASAAEPRVSTIELFFDLVFVFTITRLTHLLEHGHSALDFVRAFLVLTLIWWIYAGYAWLTNGAANERRLRPVLIAAMVGFLFMALAVPDVFHGSGVQFGIAYLYVTVLHLAAFLRMGGPGVGKAVLRLLPFNLGAALLTLAGGLIHTWWSWLLLFAAVALIVAATLRHTERGFSIHAAHFVERHGLILIIALGESIIAVGAAAAEYEFNVNNVAGVTAAVVLLATIWWSYFDGDDVRAERALLARDPADRASAALRAFWWPYLVMIFGIVLTAAGHKLSGAAPLNPVNTRMLGVGVAVYLVGSALFRISVGIGEARTRLVSAATAVVLALALARFDAHVLLAVLPVLLVGMLVVERDQRRARG